ncbi:hypothetical protein AVEN_193330-1, partial [Araneus ventricosus]
LLVVHVEEVARLTGYWHLSEKWKVKLHSLQVQLQLCNPYSKVLKLPIEGE